MLRDEVVSDLRAGVGVLLLVFGTYLNVHFSDPPAHARFLTDLLNLPLISSKRCFLNYPMSLILLSKVMASQKSF